MKKKIVIKWIAIGFIIVGVGLSFINFLSFRSLWLDEAMLALNIVNKSTLDLLKPLDYHQVAPIGFLMIEKFFVFLFGNFDWALRIFPLISFFTGIFLIYLTTYKILKSKLVGLYTAAFFATSFMMLSYSTEVKQYIVDIVIGLVILLTTIKFNENGFKNYRREYAIVGLLSIWFSNVAFLLLFSSGIYSIYKIDYSNKKNILRLFIVLGLWFFSFLTYYVLFIHNHPTRDFMVNYWENIGAFIPQNILSIEFYKSLIFRISEYFRLLGPKKLVFLLSPICILGVLFLFKKKKGVLFLLTFPLLLHLILSYLKMYPFSHRLILYLYPSLLIVIFSGFYFLCSLFSENLQKLLYTTLPLLLAVNSFISFRIGIPVEKEEIKKSMTIMSSKLVKGDNIYVYYAARHAFNFYKEQFNLKIDSADIVLSTKNSNNLINYREPILKLNNSVWLLFSRSGNKNENNITEEEYILNIFRNEGYQILDEHKYKGSSVYHAIRKMPTPNKVYK